MEKSRLHFPLYLLYSFCWCVILTCHEMHQWGYLHAPMGLSAPMGVSCRINIVCSQSRRVPALRAKPGNPGYGFRRARWRDTVADPADAAHCEEVRIPSCRLPGHASAGSLSPARHPNRSASEPAVPQVLRRAGFDGPTVDRVRARVQEVADRWNAGPPRPPPLPHPKRPRPRLASLRPTPSLALIARSGAVRKSRRETPSGPSVAWGCCPPSRPPPAGCPAWAASCRSLESLPSLATAADDILGASPSAQCRPSAVSAPPWRPRTVSRRRFASRRLGRPFPAGSPADCLQPRRGGPPCRLLPDLPADGLAPAGGGARAEECRRA